MKSKALSKAFQNFFRVYMCFFFPLHYVLASIKTADAGLGERVYDDLSKVCLYFFACTVMYYRVLFDGCNIFYNTYIESEKKLFLGY